MRMVFSPTAWFWCKWLLMLTLCQVSFAGMAQDRGKLPQSKSRVQVTIPDMPKNAARKQAEAEAKSNPGRRSVLKTPQQPMTQKYVQSGLMRVPVMNAPARKRTSNKKIYLEHAESLTFDGFVNPDFQILSGNVRFRHEGAKLFSDSAHYYPKTNSLYCFGNVHMEQGDTLFLYGAWLFYDGATKLAQVREKVRLENRNVTLFTDSLNFDRVSNLGYFFDGGLLVDGANELSSEYGQYSPETKVAHFRNDVKLVHPKFVLTNNELLYNTNTHVADINVPTDIVADSAYIFTTKGNYNTSTDKCVLYNRSYVVSDHRRLTGDTVKYESGNTIGEAFGNVVLVDTLQQITMIGGYGYSDEKKGFALMAREPFMIEHSTRDSLWLHGDTLKTVQDSIFKNVMAFHQVRFFRNDFQGLCDSLFYSTRDSVLSFYDYPVLWSENQQITGDFIQLHTKYSKPDWMHIQRSAMLIEQVTDSLYNQTSGKDLKAYFDSGQVVKVEIRGNAQTIYLPLDDDKSIIGLNNLQGSSLDLYRKEGKVEKIVIWPKPVGKFYPLLLLDPSARFLGDFAWYEEGRPQKPEDIFVPYSMPKKNKISLRNRISNR
jgi:lipopolysaccharide export system protein LptA